MPDTDEPAKPRPPPSPEELERIWSRVVLDAEAKARVFDCIRRFNDREAAPPRGLLIYGPPGTGKTEIVRAIAASVSGAFRSLRVTDVRGQYVGQTSMLVQDVWRNARGHDRCVLTLDWCEGYFGLTDSSRADFAYEELMTEFRAQWAASIEQGGGVWFVGETFRAELMHPAILSLFETLVETRLPATWAERAAIMTRMMREHGIGAEIPAFVEAATAGLSGRQLLRRVQDVCLQGNIRGEPTPSEATWRDVLERLRS